MSVKPLRQPRIKPQCVDDSTPSLDKPKIRRNIFSSPPLQVIVNLKDKSKLVVSLDAYHGVIQMEDYFKCIFCEIKIYDETKKAQHVKDGQHLKWMEKSPHLECYAHNLLRQVIHSGTYFCTLCSVIIMKRSLHQHIKSEGHNAELLKARNKALFYKPVPL